MHRQAGTLMPRGVTAFHGADERACIRNRETETSPMSPSQSRKDIKASKGGR